MLRVQNPEDDGSRTCLVQDTPRTGLHEASPLGRHNLTAWIEQKELLWWGASLLDLQTLLLLPSKKSIQTEYPSNLAASQVGFAIAIQNLLFAPASRSLTGGSSGQSPCSAAGDGPARRGAGAGRARGLWFQETSWAPSVSKSTAMPACAQAFPTNTLRESCGCHPRNSDLKRYAV